MVERYIRQQIFTNTVYLADCPVLLEKGAVLLDSKTNIYMLQMKFGNVEHDKVSSIRVYVEAVCADGTMKYPGLYVDYNELVSTGDYFGSKKLIPLPNNDAVSFRVYVEQVVLASKNVLTYDRNKYIQGENRAGEEEKFQRADKVRLKREREQEEKKRLYSIFKSPRNIIVYVSSWILFFILYGIFDSIIYDLYIYFNPAYLIVVVIISLILFIFAFRKPALFKVFAFMALISPLLILASALIDGGLRYSLTGSFVLFFLLSTGVWYIPFLSMFFALRKLNKSINFIHSLLFFMKPAKVDKIKEQTISYTSQVGNNINTFSRKTASQINEKFNEKINEKNKPQSNFCSFCGNRFVEKAKFCGKCGNPAG